jgi:ribosomal protein S18 acetylase RimI-like enzyme
MRLYVHRVAVPNNEISDCCNSPETGQNSLLEIHLRLSTSCNYLLQTKRHPSGKTKHPGINQMEHWCILEVYTRGVYAREERNKVDTIAIRQATEQDIDALINLYDEFHLFHVEGVPDRLRRTSESATPEEEAELKDVVGKLLQREDVAMIIALIGDLVVGLAEVYMREDEPHPLVIPHRYGHLQSLIVSASVRKRKLGRLLVEAAQHWAKEKGATEMQLDIWEFEAGPLYFYEHLGYRTLKRLMVVEF